MPKTLTGRELQQHRQSAGLTQAAIAEALSVPLHVIANIEGWYDEAFSDAYLAAVRRVLEQAND